MGKAPVILPNGDRPGFEKLVEALANRTAILSYLNARNLERVLELAAIKAGRPWPPNA